MICMWDTLQQISRTYRAKSKIRNFWTAEWILTNGKKL